MNTTPSDALITIVVKGLLPLFILAFIVLVVSLIILKLKKEKYKKAGIDQIDRMTGEEFENFCKYLFEELGMKVSKTPPKADYGVDLIAKGFEGKIAIQCKRWNKKVGVKAIQEVVAGKNYYKADKAIVVTNNFFTENAKELAKRNNVELIDRKKLVDLILKIKR